MFVGENDKNINKIKFKIPKNGNFSIIAHSYVLKGNMQKAKKLYIEFLKKTNAFWANEDMQYDYKLLFKLYPTKKEQLQQGLNLWNEIYKPLLDINKFYPKYKKAKKEKKYKEAIKYLSKVIEIQKKSHLQSQFNIADNKFSLGIMYNRNYQYAKSLNILFEAKKSYITEVNQEKDLANFYGWIAIDYKNLRKYKQALNYYNKSLAIKEKTLGKNHKYTAKSYNNIGLLYQKMGNYKQALNYYKKSLAIIKKVLGENHTYTATSYNNIGLLYQKMGDYKQALSYYKKSLLIRIKILGENHTDTSTSYNNIGLLYQKMGNYKQTLNYYKKSLAINEKLLGTYHIFTATNYNNVGGIYNELGDYKQALNYYKKSGILHYKPIP